METHRTARRATIVVALALVALSAAGVASLASSWWRGTAAPAIRPRTMTLATGWSIAPTTDVPEGGADVSTTGFVPDGWTPTRVPATVLGALTQAGEYPDLYLGDAIEDVPQARFEVPWWYRTEFRLDDQPDARTWLHLNGINYRAEVWINGQLVAGPDRIVGTFRAFDLDVTHQVRPGRNVLAIRVDPVEPTHDLTITWIDWNPLAPDHGMGIWQPVSISRSGPVTITDPFVTSDLPLPDTSSADLTVTATVANRGATAVRARVEGTIGDLTFAQDVDLAAGETADVSFDAAVFPQLHVSDPALWWPYRMGDQPLERLSLTASVDDAISDATQTAFGIREVTSEMTPEHHRVFSINGKRILVRGGGWASDMLLRPIPGRVDDQLTYVRDLGLNTIRLEGKLETDHFFDQADRLGILVLPGWMCCDRWQKNAKWDQEDYEVAAASMTTQALRMRNHPSVIAFMIGSDTAPPPPIADLYVKALRDVDWPNPILASANQDGSPSTGPTGVKMTGPYDWVPPGYWYDDRGPGAAFGFNTETSAGASIPELEDVERMLTPAERLALWTSPQTPQAHAGTGESVFNNFRIFDRAMNARLGKPTSLADYVEKAQVLQYENERAMFEAFSRNRYTSTGLIQWMLNNAWPSLHWNLFDWFLEPNGSTFGAKLANEPVHIQYGYDDGGVSIVNDTPADADDMRAQVRVFDLAGRRRYVSRSIVSVPADGVVGLDPIPAIDGLSDVYFVRLDLSDANGATVSTNTYWLAPEMDSSDFGRTRWFFTPTARFADMRALDTLPEVRPDVTACATDDGSGGGTAAVSVTNPTGGVAFFLRLRLATGSDGANVTPILWTDNDLTLMPGERRSVTAQFRWADDLRLIVRGWNASEEVVRLSPCS